MLSVRDHISYWSGSYFHLLIFNISVLYGADFRPLFCPICLLRRHNIIQWGFFCTVHLCYGIRRVPSKMSYQNTKQRDKVVSYCMHPARNVLCVHSFRSTASMAERQRFDAVTTTFDFVLDGIVMIFAARFVPCSFSSKNKIEWGCAVVNLVSLADPTIASAVERTRTVLCSKGNCF